MVTKGRYSHGNAARMHVGDYLFLACKGFNERGRGITGDVLVNAVVVVFVETRKQMSASTRQVLRKNVIIVFLDAEECKGKVARI